ncbi:hypothetical protein ACFLU0_00505 [Chloroflexota bacterium]
MNVVRKEFKFDYPILLLIMALAFYIAFIPHYNYLYPVHVDEWVHLAYSDAILQSGRISFVDPFLGWSPVGLINPLPESGFYLFLSTLQQISGLAWINIFRYFPSFIFMLTVLSVYVLANREGFGWEAALLTCLIPTTLGVLGPGFLVPLSLGLLFIPISLFLVFNFRTPVSYFLLFFFTCFLLFMHAATAVGLIIIVIPYILLSIKGNFRHSAFITLAMGTPFLVFPWIFSIVLPTASSLLQLQPLPDYIELPRIIQTYGYLPVALCLVGVFILTIRRGKRNYGLVLGLLILLAMLATFFTLHYGIPTMYFRGLMYTMLIMSIIAGAGLMITRKLRLPEVISTRLKPAFITQNIGKLFCLALVCATLAIAIPARQNTTYYHMIDDQDYEAFVWIENNVSEDYAKAILDPWKATAFAAITGKWIFTRIHAYPQDTDYQAYAFLEGGCSDTEFLRQNNLSIIYTQLPCDNPDLIKVKDNIYLKR